MGRSYLRCLPRAEGLCWVSRRDDRALPVVIFGDRVDAADLSPMGAPLDLLTIDTMCADLVILADRIGVKLVDGKSSITPTVRQVTLRPTQSVI